MQFLLLKVRQTNKQTNNQQQQQKHSSVYVYEKDLARHVQDQKEPRGKTVSVNYLLDDIKLGNVTGIRIASGLNPPQKRTNKQTKQNKTKKLEGNNMEGCSCNVHHTGRIANIRSIGMGTASGLRTEA